MQALISGVVFVAAYRKSSSFIELSVISDAFTGRACATPSPRVHRFLRCGSPSRPPPLANTDAAPQHQPLCASVSKKIIHFIPAFHNPAFDARHSRLTQDIVYYAQRSVIRFRDTKITRRRRPFLCPFLRSTTFEHPKQAVQRQRPRRALKPRRGRLFGQPCTDRCTKSQHHQKQGSPSRKIYRVVQGEANQLRAFYYHCHNMPDSV